MIIDDTDSANLRIKLGRHFRDHECSVKLGDAKTILISKGRPKKTLVDMSDLVWADPLPLLALGSLLCTVAQYGTEVTVDLGSSTTSDEHRVFLKFLSTQGFISAFSQFANCLYDEQLHSRDRIHLDVDELIHELGRWRQTTSYGNADCIFAKFIAVNDYRNHQEEPVALQEQIEELVVEANSRLIKNAYGENPLVRDRLLQKTRKILFEILSNVIDHAYPDAFRGEPIRGFAGIYARLRSGLPSDPEEAASWRKLFASERHASSCPALAPFEPNPLAPWIELFICDVGGGLLANLNDWTAPPELVEVQQVLDELKKGEAGNSLQTLSRILFTQPFSRVSRSAARTSVTGLLHLGLMLQRDGDFARVYTAGQWAGSGHPWNPDRGGGFVDVVKQGSSSCAPGTWLAFGIQPIQHDFAFPKDRWITAADKDRIRLRDALTGPAMASVPTPIRFEDRRSDPYCALPREWEKNLGVSDDQSLRTTSVVVLRPPRSIQKRQVGIWLDRLAQASIVLAEANSPVTIAFVIADLTPFQAITYAELLTRHSLPKSSSLDIYLVTENWAVCCLAKRSTDKASAPITNLDSATQFLSYEPTDSKFNYSVPSAVALLHLLRYADSTLFWKSIRLESDPQDKSPTEVFLNARVSWPSSRSSSHEDTPKKVINGYLDLSVALADVERYEACHRALRRCLNLFPDFEVVPSDDLIRSLTFEADKDRHRLVENASAANLSNRQLVVGSIRVTSGTVTRYLSRAGIPEGSKEIFILCHPDSILDSDEKRPIAVLDWMAPIRSNSDTASDPEYERIPESPYVGKGGERAIVIPRFQMPDPGIKTLTNSYYERNPQQTYDDLHKLGAVKLGHWVYGNKHDLITINLGRALELSILDNGPLFQWIVRVVDQLFVGKDSGGPNASLSGAVLVYPSHPITDQLIAVLKRRSRGAPTDAKTGQWLEDRVVPLKFLLPSSVSPIRVSPLAYSRLRSIVTSVQKATGQCRVVILDDGTLSGKVFRELEELVRALDVTEIHTVALVDRSGLPTELRYMDQFITRHHRFWRWDVPPLGHRRGCLLCTALNQISAAQARVAAIRARMSIGSVGRRLSQWMSIWKSVEVMDHWERHGLESISLGKNSELDSHRFCIYPNQPDDSEHTVLHQSSTGIAAAIMEITRSTTRSNYAMEKAEKLVKAYGPGIGIEIIAAQFLLFADELNYWDRLDRLRKLLRLTWECNEDSDITALSGLCVAVADDDLLPDLWQWVKNELLRRVEVPILDARIAVELLRNRYSRLPGVEPDLPSECPTDEERHNYLVIFSDGTFRHAVGRLFDIVGSSHREIHNMGLSACFKEIRSTIETRDQGRAVVRQKEAKQTINDLAETIEMLDLRFCTDDKKTGVSPMDDAIALRAIVNCGPSIEIGSEERYFEQLAQWVSQADSEVLSPSNGNSLAARYRSQLVFVTNTSEAKNTFLRDLPDVICSKEWAQLVSLKHQNRKAVCARWVDPATGEATSIRPTIEGTSIGPWDQEMAVYYDRHVRHCLLEILMNCVHIDEDIPNPWKGGDDNDTGLHATMWWRVGLSEDGRFLEVQFVNSCDKKEIILAPTEALSGLERVGGEVVVYVIDKASSGYHPATMGHLAPSRYVSALTGVPSTRRAALSLVRIPLMRTVQER